jgi:hypothetical protein
VLLWFTHNVVRALGDVVDFDCLWLCILQAFGGKVCSGADASSETGRFRPEREILDAIPTGGFEGHAAAFICGVSVEGLLPHGVQVFVFISHLIHVCLVP